MNNRTNRSVGNRWKAKLDRLMLAIVWGIGYFFGFSLVSILSFGLCHAEEFFVLIEGQKRSHRFFFFKEHGKFYLKANVVAVIGWIFISFLSFVITQ